MSIDQPGSKLNIDAMAMDYPVYDKDELAKVHPGDEITADYVENIVVVRKK